MGLEKELELEGKQSLTGIDCARTVVLRELFQQVVAMVDEGCQFAIAAGYITPRSLLAARKYAAPHTVKSSINAHFQPGRYPSDHITCSTYLWPQTLAKQIVVGQQVRPRVNGNRIQNEANKKPKQI